MSKESEWKTRQQRINTKLRLVNPQWTIIQYREGLDTSTFHTPDALIERFEDDQPASYTRLQMLKSTSLDAREEQPHSANPHNQ